MATLFISDLHLDPQRPETTKAFQQLMQQSSEVEALYILGDFVEYWIGDDDNEHGLDDAFNSLSDTSKSGIPIYLMHGNRDFLIGEQFAKQYNVALIQDPCVIDLYGTKTLLMHGDLLCSDDIEYQKFRTMVRNPLWQSEFLQKSLSERRTIVHGLRATSKNATEAKTDEIMDVNQDTVEQFLHMHKVKQLIHGHTHRPNLHEFRIDNTLNKRWVLGDWYNEAQILLCDDNRCRFETISL